MPKLIDHDARRDLIVDVTWQLILRGGIEHATMREIAREAGFANGALKHYFASKDAIVEQAFHRAMSMIEAMAEYAKDLRGVAGLRALSAAALPLDEERVTAGRVLMAFWELALANEGLREEYVRHLSSWRSTILDHLEEGREDGEVVTATPDDEIVDELILLTAGANVMTLVGREYTTIEIVDRHLDRFLGRLARP